MEGIAPEEGHWLAGFIDGEGCFYVSRRRRKGYSTYTPQFRLALRADDRPVLKMIRETTGIGRLHDVTPTRKPKTHNDSAAWTVASSADCQALVAILDRFPLRSKKARDFAIWRTAVHEHARIGGKRAAIRGPAEWAHLAELRDLLVAGRAYRAA